MHNRAAESVDAFKFDVARERNRSHSRDKDGCVSYKIKACSVIAQSYGPFASTLIPGRACAFHRGDDMLAKIKLVDRVLDI